MRVKAKCNVRDANGWHLTGEVFETKQDLGANVEILDAPKPAARERTKAKETVPEAPKEEPAAVDAAEPAVETQAEEQAPRSRSSRRRKTGE